MSEEKISSVKTGLVMEGGAMRGMYTAGVTDVMMENGITFDGAAGVSAGAVFGCNYKSKQIGRVIRYNTRFCRDPRYMGLGNLIKTGDLFGAEFCYYDIPVIHDPFDIEAYASNPMEFYVVCTDADTGKPVYHSCPDGNDEDIQWMRASASMPGVSKAVRIGGMELLDGGISDSIPVEWFRSIGYGRNVVILTRPEGYRKKKSSMMPLMKPFLAKYPAVYEAVKKRHIMYNRELDALAEMEKRGEALVIRPSADPEIGRIERDPEKLRKLYMLGRSDAEAKLSVIRDFVCR